MNLYTRDALYAAMSFAAQREALARTGDPVPDVEAWIDGLEPAGRLLDLTEPSSILVIKMGAGVDVSSRMEMFSSIQSHFVDIARRRGVESGYLATSIPLIVAVENVDDVFLIDDHTMHAHGWQRITS